MRKATIGSRSGSKMVSSKPTARSEATSARSSSRPRLGEQPMTTTQPRGALGRSGQSNGRARPHDPDTQALRSSGRPRGFLDPTSLLWPAPRPACPGSCRILSSRWLVRVGGVVALALTEHFPLEDPDMRYEHGSVGPDAVVWIGR